MCSTESSAGSCSHDLARFNNNSFKFSCQQDDKKISQLSGAVKTFSVSLIMKLYLLCYTFGARIKPMFLEPAKPLLSRVVKLQLIRAMSSSAAYYVGATLCSCFTICRICILCDEEWREVYTSTSIEMSVLGIRYHFGHLWITSSQIVFKSWSQLQLLSYAPFLFPHNIF